MLGNSFYEMAVKSKAAGDYYGKVALGVVITLLGVLLFPIIGAISLVIVTIGLCILITFGSDKNIEYEYTFTDGSVEIAAVYNASKRKELYSFEMDMVSMVVPKGSPRIEHEKFSKKRDYSSKRKDAIVLCFVVENENSKELIMLEPNEKALAHIKTYARNKMYEN